MRLIDADEFIKDECNHCDGACESLPCDCLGCEADCRCDFIKDIVDAPTIDAVPVIRCKDCRDYQQDTIFDRNNCRRFPTLPITKDFFCPYGESME